MVLRISSDCMNCGVCLDHCTLTAIIEIDERYLIDPEICTECGNCQDVCLVRAIAEE